VFRVHAAYRATPLATVRGRELSARRASTDHISRASMPRGERPRRSAALSPVPLQQLQARARLCNASSKSVQNAAECSDVVSPLRSSPLASSSGGGLFPNCEAPARQRLRSSSLHALERRRRGGPSVRTSARSRPRCHAKNRSVWGAGVGSSQVRHRQARPHGAGFRGEAGPPLINGRRGSRRRSPAGGALASFHRATCCANHHERHALGLSPLRPPRSAALRGSHGHARQDTADHCTAARDALELGAPRSDVYALSDWVGPGPSVFASNSLVRA
jgi:hypothetical protein